MIHDENTPPHVRQIREKLARDLGAPIEKLLEAMHKDAALTGNTASIELRRTLVAFATFLGRLSIEADATAAKNLNLSESNLKSQEKVISLTKALFWFTGALIVIAIAQVVIAGLQLKEAKLSNAHPPTQQGSPAKP